MLDLDAALEAVLARTQPLPPQWVSLEMANRRWLAEDVTADLDLPPFAKALVDGYAIRSADFPAGSGRFRVVETIPAGHAPSRSLGPGDAALIMTGAPLPDGADAVVMREEADPDGTEWVHLRPEKPVRPGLNGLPRGREMRAGETVLLAGQLLGPAQVGLLASVGRAEVLVHGRPRVVVIPTGDELVEADRFPGPGQIRNSNGPMLRAFLESRGAEVVLGPIAPDHPARLREALAGGLAEADVLVVAGGVSAGDLDLVPSTLIGLGVERVFHKVRLKPGKPLWFGVGPVRGGAGHSPMVFGLPGNPVGAAVCALLFVGPALSRLLGGTTPEPVAEPGILAREYVQRGVRPTYHPSRITRNPDGSLPQVEPLDWAGSADLRGLSRADGFARFPEGDCVYGRGDAIRFVAFP